MTPIKYPGTPIGLRSIPIAKSKSGSSLPTLNKVSNAGIIVCIAL